MKIMKVHEVKQGDGDVSRSFRNDGDLEDALGKNLQLFPGIPDEITISHIATKIHWKDVYSLSSVSRQWNATIKSRVIFEARSSSQSTQTLFAFQGHMQRNRGWQRQTFPRGEFFLYSPKDDSCYQLPPNPDIDIRPKDLGCECECVFLEGKLYVFGGASRSSKLDCTNVFVYDLVGQEGWKPCAPMQPRMVHFQCAVIHGKIYVFNGAKVRRRKDSGQIVYDTEASGYSVESFGYTMYDPEQDSWSPLTFDTFNVDYRRLHQKMISVGETLVVYQGPCGEADLDDHPMWELSADRYSPTTRELETLEGFRLHYSDLIIKIDDKIHRLYRRSREVYTQTGIDYIDMNFCDGTVVDDVLYLLESRDAISKKEGFKEYQGEGDFDDHYVSTDEVVLIAISGWKGHVEFEIDAHEGGIEIIDTMITEYRETNCCLPKEERLKGFFRCPVRL